jgi:hypothetical protein
MRHERKSAHWPTLLDEEGLFPTASNDLQFELVWKV